jgi:indolepyruvate ferredoxin oxidoreductase
MSATAALPPIDQTYTLEDKYTRSEGRIYLSGVQALVRLPLMQQMRDRAAGLNTGGFISGYRGSPLGGFDLELWKAKKHLAASNIQFTPGLNEDLGATMVWGTQQTTCSPARASMACSRCGTARAGASIAAATCSSTPMLPAPRSTAACSRWPPTTTPAVLDPAARQCEHEFVSAMMPVLNPAGVQDILDMGLLGWEHVALTPGAGSASR